MEKIENLEHAQLVINLLTRQRESLSDSYILQVAEFQKLATIATEQQNRIAVLEGLLRENSITVPGEEETADDSKAANPRRKK